MIDFKEYYTPCELDNGMIRVMKKPHVTDLANLESACAAPETSSYYFVSRYLEKEIDGIKLLTELSKLQDTNPDSRTFGCLKWYRESKRIQDTNSAFFTLRNICYALKFCPQNIPDDEKEIMLPMLKNAVSWFKKECKKGGFFYPNKIMSDGALLLFLSDVLGDDTLINDANNFWTRWMDYTDEYGWGWGENTSKCYSAVMRDALIVALMCMQKGSDIYNRLLSFYKKMLDYCAYHGEYEFVPSIRTYNFKGLAKNGRNPANLNPDYDKITNGVIAECILRQYAPDVEITPDTASFHVERIFGNSYASTYKGENIRLGTISKFPVMTNCYGENGWGLGWQSMPISAVALNHETSFMRYVTVSNGESRSHISTEWKDKNLFPDENVPDIYTYSAQMNNTAVVVRMIDHFANKTSFFSDEWFFQHFDGVIKNIGDWFVFDYGDCSLCIKAIGGTLRLEQDGETVRLMNVLYEGNEKLIVRHRIINTWAVTVFDNNCDVEAELKKLQVTKENIYDPRYSRLIPPFRLTCGEATIEFDPDKTQLI